MQRWAYVVLEMSKSTLWVYFCPVLLQVDWLQHQNYVNLLSEADGHSNVH